MLSADLSQLLGVVIFVAVVVAGFAGCKFALRHRLGLGPGKDLLSGSPRLISLGVADPSRPAGVVFDPDIPSADRALLAASRGDLIAAGWTPDSLLWPASWLARKGQRVAREYHGRYLISSIDHDEPARDLLRRAQTAIEAVLQAEVGTAGMIDRQAVEVALRGQEWDIAQTLRDQSELRAARSVLTGGDQKPGKATRRVLGPQVRALAMAERAVTGRIKALERYADRVARADAAYRDWETALRLSALNDEHLDLLARTVRDKQAMAEIEGLTEQGRLAERVLRDVLAEVAQAAQVLTLPAASA